MWEMVTEFSIPAIIWLIVSNFSAMLPMHLIK
jgi:hypothetical protein